MILFKCLLIIKINNNKNKIKINRRKKSLITITPKQQEYLDFVNMYEILANTLESSGLIVGIKKESDGNKKQNTTNLQFLINRMATKKSLIFILNLIKKKQKIINDKIEQEKFINDWK